MPDPSRVAVPAEELGAERIAVQADLRGSRLPSLLCQVDPGPYGVSARHLELLEALETGFAVTQALAGRLRSRLPERVCTWLPMYLGAHSVLQKLPVEDGTSIRVGGSFSESDIGALAQREHLVAAWLSDYISYLNFYRGHSQADKRLDVPGGPLRCTRAYFQLVSNTLSRLLRMHHEFDTVERLRIDLPQQKYTGLEPIEEVSPNELMDVTLDDIVGNEEFARAGQRLAHDVAGFDFETHQNPKRLNPVLFAMGDPGCGKTVTCHAIGQYFLAFCKARSIPARFLTIRRSDWASSYQNASAAQLIDIFKNQVAGFAGAVGVYWPDIDTAFAAREDPGVRSEEKNILGACFGIFDGTIIPKNGQWFMLCDANTLNMDRAAVSRITQDPFTLKGPVTSLDFAVLMRDKKLRTHQQYVPLSEEEWQSIGDLCVELGLSGRSIENITRRIVTEIEDFDYPEEYFHATLARRQDILREQSRRIEKDRLIAILHHYKKFEQEAEERAYRSRFQDRVREIVFNANAHEAARRVNSPGP